MKLKISKLLTISTSALITFSHAFATAENVKKIVDYPHEHVINPVLSENAQAKFLCSQDGTDEFVELQFKFLQVEKYGFRATINEVLQIFPGDYIAPTSKNIGQTSISLPKDKFRLSMNRFAGKGYSLELKSDRLSINDDLSLATVSFFPENHGHIIGLLLEDPSKIECNPVSNIKIVPARIDVDSLKLKLTYNFPMCRKTDPNENAAPGQLLEELTLSSRFTKDVQLLNLLTTTSKSKSWLCQTTQTALGAIPAAIDSTKSALLGLIEPKTHARKEKNTHTDCAGQCLDPKEHESKNGKFHCVGQCIE